MKIGSVRLWQLSFLGLLLVSALVGAWIIQRARNFTAQHNSLVAEWVAAESDVRVLAALVPVLSRDIRKADVVRLLRSQNARESVSEVGNRVYVGRLRFEFGPDDHLVKVSVS